MQGRVQGQVPVKGVRRRARSRWTRVIRDVGWVNGSSRAERVSDGGNKSREGPERVPSELQLEGGPGTVYRVCASGEDRAKRTRLSW